MRAPSLFNSTNRSTGSSKPAVELDKVKLQSYILEAFRATKPITNQELILVIGNTGAGKSSTINYLLGCPMEGYFDEIGIPRVRVKAGFTEHAKIGNGLITSETFYPKPYLSADGSSFCDFPGFGENGRGQEAQITVAIATKIAINIAKQINSIVVVIHQAELKSSRAECLRKVFSTLQDFFSYPEQSEKILDVNELSKNIIFVFTRSTENMDYSSYFEEIKIEAVKFKNRELIFMCELILRNKNRIVEINPLDDGRCRKILQNLIKDSAPLSPEVFGFAADADTKRILKNLMTETAIEGLHLLDNFFQLPSEISSKKNDQLEQERKLQDVLSKINELNQNDKKHVHLEENNAKCLKELIKDAKDRKEDNIEERKNLEKRKAVLTEAIQNLDQSIPVKYWEECYDEEKIFGVLKEGTETTTVMQYSGVSFIDFERSSFGEGARFTEEIKDQAGGKFSIRYTTGKKYYGTGRVVIYVQKRAIPENEKFIKEAREEIKQIETQLVDRSKNLDKAQEHINGLENKYFEFCEANSEQAKEHMKLLLQMYDQEKQTIENRLVILSQEISHSECLFQETQQILIRQLDFFEMVVRISNVLGHVGSPHVERFLAEYSKYSRGQFQVIDVNNNNHIPSAPPVTLINSTHARVTTKSTYCAPPHPATKDINSNNNAPSAPPLTLIKPVQAQVTNEISYNDLVLNKQIGVGGSANVYRAKWKNKDVAVKVLFTQKMTKEEDSKFKAEYQLLIKLHHPNIIAVEGCSLDNNGSFCLVMEYCEKGALSDYIYYPTIWNNPLSWRLDCASNICRGLEFLHDNNVLHLDLKPNNIFIRSDWTIVLGDFGISRQLETQRSNQTTLTNAGTPVFMAPEIIQPAGKNGKTQYSRENDIYSLGMVLWCCIAQKIPFEDWNMMRVLHDVVYERIREEIPRGAPIKLANLITFCWAHEQRKRPTAKQAALEMKSITEDPSMPRIQQHPSPRNV